MKFNQSFLILVFVFFLGSCAVEPQPINYGTDACHYCKMNIVDNQHAAEFVTSKGKCYKFDAIECMLNKMQEFDETQIELHLVCNYSNPGELLDAKSAAYLVSKNIPSPMGGFLSGFANKESAAKIQGEAGGDLYSWEELQKKYNL